MEFLGLYNTAIQTLIMLGNTSVEAAWVSLLLVTAVCVTLFVLQGVGLRMMAKKQNIKKSWLAFVPFANIWLLGKLAGTAEFFGQKIKNIGLYTMIAQIVCSIMYALMIAAQVYLVHNHGLPHVTELGDAYWLGLKGFSITVEKFYRIGNYFLSILSLISEILVFILMLSVYKKYYPKSHLALGMLALFVPISRYITVFVLRKRTPIDFDAYMRARREAYMRSRQQYYGGYNGYNPYGQQPQQPRPEDPFSEFKSGKTEGEQPPAQEPKDENPFEEF